jgi:hypothetical protein
MGPCCAKPLAETLIKHTELAQRLAALALGD